MELTASSVQFRAGVPGGPDAAGPVAGEKVLTGEVA